MPDNDFDIIIDMVNNHAKVVKTQNPNKTDLSKFEFNSSRPSSPRPTPPDKSSGATGRPETRVDYVPHNAPIRRPSDRSVLKSKKKYKKPSRTTIIVSALLLLCTVLVAAIAGKGGAKPTPAPTTGGKAGASISGKMLPGTETAQQALETMLNNAGESTPVTTAEPTPEPTINKYANPDDHIHLKMWGGQEYYICDEDYVVYLAGQALEELKTNIRAQNPESTYLKTLEAGFIDETLLAATASKESDFRIKTADGEILHNGDIAFGMTQGTRPTMDTVNNNFGRYGYHFTPESLIDPLEALKFTALVYTINSTNYLAKSVDIFDPANFDLAKWFSACSYYHGGGGANKFYKEGTLKEQRYPQELMRREYNLEDNYSASRDR